ANNGSIGNNHRFDWNAEYRPEDKSYIKLLPTFSLRNNRSNNFNSSSNLQNNLLINDLTNRQTDLTYTPSFGGSGLYNRRLNDRGRNVFVNFSLHSSSNDQDQERILNTLMYTTTPEEADSVYQQHLVNLRNKNLNGGASLSYIEPLG